MKTLRYTALSLLLVATISVGAAAQNGCIPGDTQSPPCGCNPGDTQSPPCATAQMATDNETTAASVNGQVNYTTDVVTTATMDLVETLLSIF